MTSYSEEEMTPKTLRVKFVKLSASSTPIMVPRPLQVMEATRHQGLTKDRWILPLRSQS